MDIGIIKKKDEKIIYEELLPFLDEFYNSTLFVLIEKFYYDSCCRNAIHESISEYNESMGDYVEYIKNKIISQIDYVDNEYKDSYSQYVKEIKRYSLLSKDEEIELFNKIKNGDMEAKERIINCNLRLVVSVAAKYLNKGLAFEDLIQEGNIGLMHAVDKFDLSFDDKFSTYAYWWVRQYIVRAVADKSRVIRLPVHIYEKLALFKKKLAQYAYELGRNPTYNEIAEHMHLSMKQVDFYTKLLLEYPSLNDSVGEEEGLELLDIIQDKTVNIEEKAERVALNEILDKMVEDKVINQRDLDMLKMRFGFDDSAMLTLNEIGEKYNITRERVRQIQDRTLAKIKSVSKNYGLDDYIK